MECAPCVASSCKRRDALMKQVYEGDPLSCPKCGTEMKVIALIEGRQTAVVEKFLRLCGLWEEERPARANPPVPEPRGGNP